MSRLSVGGLNFQAVSAVINGMMHFSIGQDDLSMPIPVYPEEIKVLHVIMTQLSLREGLKRFGERGKKGALNEMQQLHDMTTFFPKDPKSLTAEECRRALSSLIFLKEKRSGEARNAIE